MTLQKDIVYLSKNWDCQTKHNQNRSAP